MMNNSVSKIKRLETISLLYELSSFSYENLEDLKEKLIEKTTRLLGAKRIAASINFTEEHKLFFLWGFKNLDHLYYLLTQPSPYTYHYNIKDLGWIFLEFGKHMDFELEKVVRLFLKTLENILTKIKAQFKLLENVFSTAKLICRAMALRDPYTALHQERVAQISVLIAKELGLKEEKINNIKLGALIHDIGKIGVPEMILSKPGTLIEEEISLLRLHPKRGYELLKDLDFPEPVKEIVLHHHERLDGSGYPDKLKEDEICLEVRIVMVADVIEAMGAHRPYRPAKSFEEILEELKKGRGILYDREVVDVALDLILSGKLNFIWYT